MSKTKHQKQDLRVEKTRRALVAGLFALLERRPLGKITVNDICELALVSRATFYVHFEDKYHLLRYALQQVREEIREKSEHEDREVFLLETLSCIAERPKLFRHLFVEEGNSELTRMLSDHFAELVMDEMERGGDCGMSEEQTAIVAVFLSGGATSLIAWWIDSGFAMDKEELAENLSCMFKVRT